MIQKIQYMCVFFIACGLSLSAMKDSVEYPDSKIISQLQSAIIATQRFLIDAIRELEGEKKIPPVGIPDFLSLDRHQQLHRMYTVLDARVTWLEHNEPLQDYSKEWDKLVAACKACSSPERENFILNLLAARDERKNPFECRLSCVDGSVCKYQPQLSEGYDFLSKRISRLMEHANSSKHKGVIKDLMGDAGVRNELLNSRKAPKKRTAEGDYLFEKSCRIEDLQPTVEMYQWLYKAHLRLHRRVELLVSLK